MIIDIDNTDNAVVFGHQGASADNGKTIMGWPFFARNKIYMDLNKTSDEAYIEEGIVNLGWGTEVFDNNGIILFFIENEPFVFESGLTWANFVSSAFNINNFSNSGSFISRSGYGTVYGCAPYESFAGAVKPTDYIMSTYNYTYVS